MSVFADKSAFYALVIETETTHGSMRAAFHKLLENRRPILTTSFVIIETMALLQQRIGLNAARQFDEGLSPVVRVKWVDEELYRRGTERLWREDSRELSLGECA